MSWGTWYCQYWRYRPVTRVSDSFPGTVDVHTCLPLFLPSELTGRVVTPNAHSTAEIVSGRYTTNQTTRRDLLGFSHSVNYDVVDWVGEEVPFRQSLFRQPDENS